MPARRVPNLPAFNSPTTAGRAGRAIAITTIVVAVAGGLLIWWLDTDEFPTFGTGMWWSLQTITTVGYGDVTPESTTGRLIAAVVMVTGIAFVSVVTASISAAFVESARRRRGVESDPELIARLERIERALEELKPTRE